MPWMNFVTHLECANCGKQYDATKVHNLCTACQRPLWVRYDLAALKKGFNKKALFGRPPTIWRYLEMLPMQDPANIVSLTETITPILETKRLAAHFGVKHLFVKDESRLPTGSFKARGMALELAEQFEWELPDVILYPTGGGTGLIGMWKAFAELETLGWLKSSKKPKMISCQSDGCAPIAVAFEKGERFAKKFENATTIASGIRVPAAVGDFMILDAVRQSGGVAMASPEADIPKWMCLASSQEGVALCPETAVCYGALEILLERGIIKKEEHILVFNTGAAQKYPEAIHEEMRRLDITKPIDWQAIELKAMVNSSSSPSDIRDGGNGSPHRGC